VTTGEASGAVSSAIRADRPLSWCHSPNYPSRPYPHRLGGPYEVWEGWGPISAKSLKVSECPSTSCSGSMSNERRVRIAKAGRQRDGRARRLRFASYGRN
jgi:hypothetical protein